MDDRERRIAANEAVFRQANEELEALQGSTPGTRLDLLCECGVQDCTDTLELRAEEYQLVRADPLQFAVKPGHETHDVETVIARHDGYFVVRKDDPEAQALVRATDQRSD